MLPFHQWIGVACSAKFPGERMNTNSKIPGTERLELAICPYRLQWLRIKI
ncbi:conserved hypothetical protein [Ricinus communis]|uniref:Uncharacterized protein n=1 Tax=Ricinus communis TaxID=3988 RepID=B9SJE4_RICCO|nr:conserved hypothetical protein [Ricinus communis]